MLNYWKELMLENGNLKNLESPFILFNTAHGDIDEYIEHELEQARLNERDIDRGIAFAKAEQVFYEIANQNSTGLA